MLWSCWAQYWLAFRLLDCRGRSSAMKKIRFVSVDRNLRIDHICATSHNDPTKKTDETSREPYLRPRRTAWENVEKSGRPETDPFFLRPREMWKNSPVDTGNTMTAAAFGLGPRAAPFGYPGLQTWAVPARCLRAVRLMAWVQGYSFKLWPNPIRCVRCLSVFVCRYARPVQQAHDNNTVQQN